MAKLLYITVISFLSLVLLVAIELLSVEIYDSYYKDNDPLPYHEWSSFIEDVSNPYLEFPIYLDGYSPEVEETKTTDAIKYGMRITPDQPSDAERHMIFLGCSFTYGHGVEDNETMPYQIMKNVPKTRVYNMGLPGYGPIESYLQLSRPPIKNYDEIKDKKVLGLFTIINDHVNRTALNFSHVYFSHLQNLTEVGVGPDGQLDREDFLYNRNKFKYTLYSIIKRSYFIKILLIHRYQKYQQLAYEVSDKENYSPPDLTLTVKVLEGIKKRFKKLFPNGEIYFFHVDNEQVVLNRLKELNLNVIGLDEPFYTKSNLPDGHLNPDGNRQMAIYLIRKLKERGAL